HEEAVHQAGQEARVHARLKGVEQGSQPADRNEEVTTASAKFSGLLASYRSQPGRATSVGTNTNTSTQRPTESATALHGGRPRPDDRVTTRSRAGARRRQRAAFRRTHPSTLPRRSRAWQRKPGAPWYEAPRWERAGAKVVRGVGSPHWRRNRLANRSAPHGPG